MTDFWVKHWFELKLDLNIEVLLLHNCLPCLYKYFYFSMYFKFVLGIYVKDGYSFLHDGRWWRFFYCSLLNLFNLVVCLIGAGMFAKTSVAILATVCISLGSTIVSFIVQIPIEVTNIFLSYCKPRRRLHALYANPKAACGLDICSRLYYDVAEKYISVLVFMPIGWNT